MWRTPAKKTLASSGLKLHSHSRNELAPMRHPGRGSREWSEDKEKEKGGIGICRSLWLAGDLPSASAEGQQSTQLTPGLLKQAVSDPGQSWVLPQ